MRACSGVGGPVGGHALIDLADVSVLRYLPDGSFRAWASGHTPKCLLPPIRSLE
jgi:hypothetical protein